MAAFPLIAWLYFPKFRVSNSYEEKSAGWTHSGIQPKLLLGGGHHFGNDIGEFSFQPQPHRQTDQSITRVIGVSHITGSAACRLTARRRMQGNVVKHGMNTLGLEPFDKGCSQRQARL